MNSPRPIVTILVMLIAIACLVNVQFVRAEGPFDVDNSTGGGRGPGTTVVVDPDDSDDGDGTTAVLRSSTGIIGGDWLTELVVRWVVEYFCVAEKSVEKYTPKDVKSPAVDGATVSR